MGRGYHYGVAREASVDDRSESLGILGSHNRQGGSAVG